MKKNKLILVLSVVTILVIGLSTAAFAAVDYKTPAEIVAELTGKTAEEVTADRQAGISYGAQAKEADKLDEFQSDRIALREQILDQAVLDERFTQEEADKLLDDMKLRMEDCDGTGTGAGQEQRNGTGMGLCDGTGMGQNKGTGMGMGRGAGNGTGLGCGSCADQDLA